MNRIYQREQLLRLLDSPYLSSGLYLIDTDLEDDEIEYYIKKYDEFVYHKGSLIPSAGGTGFEPFVIKLSYACENDEIADLRNFLLTGTAKNRDSILLALLTLIMRNISAERKAVIHIRGRFDLTSLTDDEVSLFDAALDDNDNSIIVINKQRATNPLIKTISLKENKYNYQNMNRIEMLHISYKHDAAYEDVMKAIRTGLEKNGIPYSIDEYDIMYRDNIDDYEKEIGASSMVIMFVIPSYLESLDCMFEMTQMFKNGNVRERIFPVVDMGTIPRNGDGLKQVKDFWHKEKVRKSEQIKDEPGSSSFVIQEIQKIDDVIKTLDDLWFFICRGFTGKFEELIKNDAAMLMEIIKKSSPRVEAPIDEKFVPSDDTMPAGFRNVVQNGEKSVYIENNNGPINIS